MQTQLTYAPLATLDTEALAIVLFERDPKLSGSLLALDGAVGGTLAALTEAGEFACKLYDTQLLFHPAGIQARRLLLLGGGKPQTFSVHELRRLAGVAARHLKGRNLRSFTLVLPPEVAAETAIKAALIGVHGANFEPGRYKSAQKEERRIESVTLAFAAGPAASTPGLEAALVFGNTAGEAQNFARDLINEPSNVLTPTRLAERAQAMAHDKGLECELIDEARARELKMGAFLSVSQGSYEPAVMIVLRYWGAGKGSASPMLGLVGKGITFDTGGISIKPSDGMEKMKYDMAGGATMIATMKAIAELKPRLNVLAIIPASENMPGGRAQKPGDVQIAMSGKSIEVLNTDAEGRLVLADGLHYARQLGATHLIDAATLTGAVAVALGAVNVGVFANNEAFYQEFARAQQAAGEKMWRLPLNEEYLDQIRGSVGDIINTGGRYGGAITAAMFLHEFVGDTPWIHLDIAGTGWLDDGKPWCAKGPTAVALPTLLGLVEDMASRN